MGREIRMVPPNWEHPKNEHGHLQPMHDKNFATAAAEWKQEFAKWEAGERPSYMSEQFRDNEYWEYETGPPTRECYRPWKDEDATWFQLWETVTEGTPVTPPFDTREELAAHLAANGDDWDRKRGYAGWGKAAADAFVSAGWAPTGMSRDGVYYDSKNVPLAMASHRGKEPL